MYHTQPQTATQWSGLSHSLLLQPKIANYDGSNRDHCPLGDNDQAYDLVAKPPPAIFRDEKSVDDYRIMMAAMTFSAATHREPAKVTGSCFAGLFVFIVLAFWSASPSFGVQEFPFEPGEGPCLSSTLQQPVRQIILTTDGQQIVVDPATPLDTLKGSPDTGYRVRTAGGEDVHLSYTQFKSVISICRWTDDWKRHATGELTLKRSPGASAIDRYIAPGLRVTTNPKYMGPKQRFYTIEGRVLKRSDPQIIVPIIAEKPGPDGAVNVGDITELEHSVFTVESARNDQPTRVLAK